MESRDMEFFYQSSTRYLSSARSDFPHPASQWRSKIVKMVNLGKLKTLKMTRSEMKRNSDHA